MATILDGKQCSSEVRAEVKKAVDTLVLSQKRIPCLAVVLVGEDPASQIYVKNKAKACNETGIISKQFILPAASTEEEIISVVSSLNSDDNVDGVLVQLPLPDGINERNVIEAIAPEKDVDVFHPVNVGKLTLGIDGLQPCTPSGIIRLLDEYNIDIEGKNCVVVGRSSIVGKPISLLLLGRNATVTICHSRTKNLGDYTANADILVVAVGKAGIIKGDMVKDGAVVIDVGMNRENGKLCGDCDFETCSAKASYITPVPGGVGPMTIAMLMKNTIKAYVLRENS